MTSPHVTGVVLAGGHGERFGAPKANALFKGERLIDVVAGVLGGIVGELIMVGRPPLPDLLPKGQRANAIVDRVQGAGPLMGFATALEYCRPGAVVLVGCDMPLLSRDLLAYELTLLEGHDAVVPVAGGRRQPLHAVYGTTVGPTAGRLLAEGALSMQGLLDALDVREVPIDEWRGFSPDGRSFLSVNTPDDLRTAESLS